MCHESWWQERRSRRAEEAREIWQDFEQSSPADRPQVADDPPAEVRLDTEPQREPVTAEP